jgi:hypothetical protein
VTVPLKIVGAQAAVDNFIQQTRSNKQDQAAAVVAEAAKSIAHAFETSCFYGAVTTSTFDGLHVICNTATPAGTYQRLTTVASATPVVMTTLMLDNLIDLVRPAPDVLIMNRNVRRQLAGYSRVKTSPVTYQPQQFGQTVTFYNGIPIVISDFILQTELCDASGNYSAATGGVTSSIFAVKFGDRALCGIQNGGIQKQNIGAAEGADANIWRLKWYCALALFNTPSAAVLTNIKDDVITA